MPIPSYPENRRESYLNNIATGSGEIPPYPENREEQYLDAIARNGGGGSGSGLPEVSAEDNGDVLTVVEGAWAKAAPSGGGGVLVVNYQADNEDLLNKTGREIVNAAKTTAVLLVDDSLEDPDTLTLSIFVLGTIGKESSDNSYWFTFFSGSESTLHFSCATLDDYPVWE